MKIPQDITMREGMKTLYADKEDTRVNYINDVVYVKRDNIHISDKAFAGGESVRIVMEK